jgi:UDP-glucose 4-epimerase
VIGGGGFIGKHLVKALLNQGRAVTVIDREPAPAKELPPGARYLAGDYGDGDFLRGALSGVDEVVDLAYASVPKTSFEDPCDDLLNNVPRSLNLFEVASSLPVRKIVIVSSGGTVYGRAVYLPIKEEHPTNPVSPYGITKLAIEKYAWMYHALKGLPVVCLRPGNAYGEGQKPFMDQGIVATAMASMLEGREISIFGKESTVRDFVHVGDIAAAIVLALDRCRPGECYNVGTGIGTSISKILSLIASIAGPDAATLRVKVMPSRRYDVPANVLDSFKFCNATGWSAKVLLPEGLELTWKHFQGRYKGCPKV